MTYSMRVAAAAALLFSTCLIPALGADLPVRRPVYKAPAPTYQAVFGWTGAYAGFNGGYGWGRTRLQTGSAVSENFDVAGGLVGATLGYNLQINQVVWGWETDLAYSMMSGTHAATSPCPGCEIRNQWLGTARIRFGWAFDRFLPYVTGGLAYGGIKVSDTFGNNETKNALGWTAGVGVEYAITPRWSTKLEYLYADLGKVTTVGGPMDVTFKTNIVRAGVNFRF